MNADTPLRRLLPLGLATGLVYVASLAFTRLPCWGLPPLLVPVAWLLWAHWSDNALFARRLWLTGVTRADSRVRRWLIRGRLVQGLMAVPALLFTALLLTMAARLDPAHWLVLALDVLVLSLVIGPLQRRLADEIQGDKAGLVARRWPLLLGNLLLLALLFFAIDYALLGAPDTRGQPWDQVAERAFRAATTDAACLAAGWAVGVPAALQALAWHLSLVVIPALSEPLLRLGAWLLFLLQAGLFGWLFTVMLLGALALVEQRCALRNIDGAPGSGGLVSTAFIYTILVLAVPYLYAVHALRHFDPGVLERPARQLLTWTDPCQRDRTAPALSDALDARLLAGRAEALAGADGRINTALDAFFARAEQGVDNYLDWYFTVVGEYQRLVAAASGDFGAQMTTKLDAALFADTGFAAWLDETYAALDRDADARLGHLADELGAQLQRAAEDSDCARARFFQIDPITGLSQDTRRASTAAAAGAAGGIIAAKLLAKQVAGAVVVKVAGKKSFQAALALAGKAAAKKGGSTLAAALGAATLCSPSGVGAVLCGIGAGAATWLVVDKAMVEIDELRFREEMRADLLAVLAEQRAVLAAALHQRQAAGIDAGLQALAGRLGQRYVPAHEP